MNVYIYSSEWLPGESTLGYYTFNKTLSDSSGKNANASNVSSNTFVPAYTGSSKYVLNKVANHYVNIPATMLSSHPTTWTMLFWFKSTQTRACWLMGPDNGADRFGGLVGNEIDNYTGIDIQYGGNRGYQRMARNPSTYRDGTRRLISFRRGSGDVIVGVNTNFDTSYYASGGSSPQNYILGPGAYAIGARRAGVSADESEFQVGDFIVENRYWSDSEIEKYLISTKSLYGIS